MYIHIKIHLLCTGTSTRGGGGGHAGRSINIYLYICIHVHNRVSPRYKQIDRYIYIDLLMSMYSIPLCIHNRYKPEM